MRKKDLNADPTLAQEKISLNKLSKQSIYYQNFAIKLRYKAEQLKEQKNS